VKPDRAVRDAERALAEEPGNLALRLRLASALRIAGRHHDALDVYRSVAVAYQREGRLLQAIAVCRSILELAPDDLETNVLLQELETARTGGAAGEEPTRHDDGHRLPTGSSPRLVGVPDDHAEDLPPSLPGGLPGELLGELDGEPDVGPEDFDFDDEPTPPPLDLGEAVRGLGSEPPAILARRVTGPAHAELAAPRG
jgi:hypothetical protein